MKRVLALAGTLALAFTMSACGNSTGPVGTWGSGANTDKKPYLKLALGAEQDGKTAGYLTGSDGCNRLAGQWMYQEDKLSLSPQPATQISCDGVDTWLSKMSSVKLDGNKLIVLDEKGDTLGTLDRSGS